MYLLLCTLDPGDVLSEKVTEYVCIVRLNRLHWLGSTQMSNVLGKYRFEKSSKKSKNFALLFDKKIETGYIPRAL